MPEVARADAGRDHQEVVVEAHLAALRHADPNLAGGRIDPLDLRHGNGDVALAAEDLPDGSGNVARREARGRDLIEQRLKKVMVLAIDQSDANRRLRQCRHRRETAEAAPKDDDARRLGRPFGSLPEGGTRGRSRAVKRLVVPGDPAHRSPFQAGRDYLDPDSLPPSA